MNLPRVELIAGEHRLQAYVARSEEDRATGLMHCRQLAPDEGMLFVDDQPQLQSFWMKNTHLPLSAAFLDEDGTILHIADMEPHTLAGHSSQRPVRFVLEVHQGWFDDKGVAAGLRIAGPPFIR